MYIYTCISSLWRHHSSNLSCTDTNCTKFMDSLPTPPIPVHKTSKSSSPSLSVNGKCRSHSFSSSGRNRHPAKHRRISHSASPHRHGQAFIHQLFGASDGSSNDQYGLPEFRISLDSFNLVSCSPNSGFNPADTASFHSDTS